MLPSLINDSLYLIVYIQKFHSFQNTGEQKDSLHAKDSFYIPSIAVLLGEQSR